ncbi:uncharacterized protein EV420DRAFT_1616112 [Desarmillaria tabescens]|uniref:Uncharacterized protein n=1 Tax=Armillaria tabescens TaxID=1929756 RepID=A0AA39NPP5_ARMTA|nr:uncharacterized protein EV420DRAFT_1616112 [Desarmillaria tabescens]KAK0469525.1 hypothetical protein EV420DRAFT_1616112 [Desarmillaria tabescens]
MASMTTEELNCVIFVQDTEGHPRQLDDDDNVAPLKIDQRDPPSSYADGPFSPLSPTSPYGYPVSEEQFRYTLGGGENIPFSRSRRSSETALPAPFPPSYTRDRSASVHGHRRHVSSPNSPLAVSGSGPLYNDFLSAPPLHQRQSQPSLQVITDIPFGFHTPPPCSASPGLTPASSVSSPFESPEEFRPQSSGGYSDHSDFAPPHKSNGVDDPYQSSTSLLLQSDPPRGRTLWRFDDDYLTPGPDSRSLSLVSMPNINIDSDFFGLRSPSVAPSTHSDGGLDLASLELNPGVGTSDIFGDIPEQQSSHSVTDTSLPPTPYREQVASDAVARASQSRRTNAANYVSKHNLRSNSSSVFVWFLR